MNLNGFDFQTVDWNALVAQKSSGATGFSMQRVKNFGNIRVRMVEYSPGYKADHWCQKGHILFCISGNLETVLQDGRRFILTPGVSYQVADNAEAHQSSTESGAVLFIVD